MAKVGTIEATITAKVEPLRRALAQADKQFATFRGRIETTQASTQKLSSALNRELAPATTKAQGGVKALAASTLNLGRAIQAAAVAWASSQLVRGMNDLARVAHEAEAGARVFEKMLVRVGESAARVEPQLQALADELRIAPEIIRSNASELLRAGYDWDQVATIYRGAGASALLAGRSTAEGIDVATSALVSGLSTYLNQIGITQNLSTAYTQYARELGKTTEQLTDAERAQAATLMIQRSTAQEVEDLQLLFQGYGGAVSDLDRAWYDFRVTLGQLVSPVVETFIRNLTRLLEVTTDLINRLRGVEEEIASSTEATLEATKRPAEDAGADAGREWAVAFAQEANKLVDLVGPGRMWDILQPISGVGFVGGEMQTVPGPPEVLGGPEAVRAWLGLEDATQEELDAVLEVVAGFAHRVESEITIGRAVAGAIGQSFDETEPKLRATQKLLEDLVESAGVPISSPFAQQLLQWITDLNNQLPKAVDELSDVQRFLKGVEALMGGAIGAGTVEYDLGVRLQGLQKQLEGGNVILAEAAKRQIDAAVGAFRDAFFETGDTAQAAAAALQALSREVEEAATGIGQKGIRAWALRMQGQADAWYESLPLWEKVKMGLRDAGRAASEFAQGLISRLPGVQEAIDAYKHATASAAVGGLGLSAAGGVAAAALAFVAANSEALGEALDAVAAGLAALLAPIDALLEMLGPKVSGALAGAGIGAAAGSIFGPVGTIIGAGIGAIAGWLGGAAQEQASAAELLQDASEAIREAAEEWREFVQTAPLHELFAEVEQIRSSGVDVPQSILDERRRIKDAIKDIENWGVWPWERSRYNELKDALREVNKQIDEFQKGAASELEDRIREALGIGWRELASGVRSAFDEATPGDFTDAIERELKMKVRNALITAFLESAAMAPLFETLSDAIMEAVRDGVMTAGELDAIEDVISQITDNSAAFFEILDQLGLSMEDLSETTSEVNEALRNVPSGFKVALRRFQATEPIPMASGGIVTRPTLALVGEAGPEAVVPLGGDGAALGTTIVVNIEGPVYGVDDLDRRITTAVGRAMRQARMATYGVT